MKDHAKLKWLTSVSHKQAKLARWCMSMAECDFELKHRPGEELVVLSVQNGHVHSIDMHQ